jgi:hypothetical protein
LTECKPRRIAKKNKPIEIPWAFLMIRCLLLSQSTE